jgi:RNA polymerase sigma factor (sigma-70 family)
MDCTSDEFTEWLTRRILPHEPALRAWLRRLTSGAIDIDDVVQETYGVLVGLSSIAHIRDPRAYLFTTARSIVLQQVRRARIVPIETLAEIEQLSIVDSASGADAVIADRQQLQLLQQELDRLPERCREAFVLRRIQGYSQREIAQRMGISENTVEKHIGLALRHLMRALAEPAATTNAAAAEQSASTRVEAGEPERRS